MHHVIRAKLNFAHRIVGDPECDQIHGHTWAIRVGWKRSGKVSVLAPSLLKRITLGAINHFEGGCFFDESDALMHGLFQSFPTLRGFGLDTAPTIGAIAEILFKSINAALDLSREASPSPYDIRGTLAFVSVIGQSQTARFTDADARPLR